MSLSLSSICSLIFISSFLIFNFSLLTLETIGIAYFSKKIKIKSISLYIHTQNTWFNNNTNTNVMCRCSSGGFSINNISLVIWWRTIYKIHHYLIFGVPYIGFICNFIMYIYLVMENKWCVVLLVVTCDKLFGLKTQWPHNQLSL